jgi:Caspase domain
VSNRNALLIGVPRYDQDDFNAPRLDAAVRCDIDAMRAALKQSDYLITECGTEASSDQASLNRINQKIEEACASAPAGSVLLVYFSGHGLSEAGTDYLVPSDAYLQGGNRAPGRPSLRSLVKVVPPDEVLRDCRASLVVFFVDACRNESDTDAPDASVPAKPVVEPGGQIPFLADGGHFVLVMGCGAGQVCQYDETGSVFTRALAGAIDSGNSARTLQEVIAQVDVEMGRRSRQQAQGAAQTPAVRYPEMLRLAGQVPVCDGDELTDAWRRAVADSELIRLCDDPDRVYEVVADCARRCRAAMKYLGDRTGLTDPWTDTNYPARVLNKAELLLRNAGLLSGPAAGNSVAGNSVAGNEALQDGATGDGAGDSSGRPAGGLRPGEAALLLAAPFLREAVIAVGIREAAAIKPAMMTRTYTAGARGDLELTHEMYQHLVHRVEGLRKRGEEGAEAAAKASDQLAMWLVHRWLADRVTLWREAGVTVVCETAASLVAGCRDSADEREVPHLVQAMLLAISADPVDERLCDRLSKPYVSDRWRRIAAVLWLSGIMAADLRRLPPVVADLVGTGMELPLLNVQTAAGSRADWVLTEDGSLDLRLVCDHPALHDAFEDIVRRADRATRTVRTELRLPADLGDGLPRGFTATPAGLRPSTRPDETPAYQVPLARFQIAEEKVRELLMGRQLYGDPALAIRELYQNALDACRWRWTRQEYRRRAHNEPADWTGRITFRQGTDAGRPYIECTDNGVGMDLGTLEHVFGNAGERFVYRQEFRTEQAAWAALDPPLRMISNSQFGVGVFSYFMLADEVVVRTRHHGAHGVPDPEAHEVRIASSGSLFQIQPTQGLPNGGTSVRLYLGGEADETSVLRTLRDLLWISEFRVEAFEGEDREVWEPGRLRYPEGTVPPRQCGEDLWWVSGDGGLAADGIRTNEKRYGLVINLREERRPQFTVDRRSLEDWDKHWVRQSIEKFLPELIEWPGYNLSWLWQVAESNPAVAQQIFEYAVKAGGSISIGAAWGQSSAVSLDAVGCMPYDRAFMDRMTSLGYWLNNWRSGVWRDLVSGRTDSWWVIPPDRVTGFPVPDPIDSALIRRIRFRYPDEMPSRDTILVALADREITVSAMLRRLRRYAITGLNVTESRYVPTRDAIVEEKDKGLLRALAMWSRSGELSERSSVGPIVSASSKLGMPLGEVIRRAGRFAPEGWDAPDFELGDLRHHICTEIEASLLSRDLNTYYSRWLSDDLPPGHLAAASSYLGCSLEEILAICDRFAPLGVAVGMRDAYPQDIGVTELHALKCVDIPGCRLSPLQLIYVAGHAGISVGAVHTALSRLEGSGLIVLPELHGDPDFTPGALHISFIEQYLKDKFGRYFREKKFRERPLLPILMQIVGRGGWEEKKGANDLALFVAQGASVNAAELAEAAYQLDISLGEVMAKFAEVCPDVHFPNIDAECAGLTVDDRIRSALLADDNEDTEWDINPSSIVGMARYLREPLGDFLGMLDPFSRLGAPVPTYDDAIRQTLNQVVLDEYDNAMLVERGEFGEWTSLRAITPLTLIRIAGRLGWTLSHAHWRLSRLVPIGVELNYPTTAPLPDEIVYWYDLQVLTKYFDGQEPAIQGRIDWPYLQNAAIEIFDCPAEGAPEKAVFLRDRLRLYAPLFQLDLPEGTSPTSA